MISLSYDNEYQCYITLECDVVQSGEEPHTSPKNLLFLSSEQDTIYVNLSHTFYETLVPVRQDKILHDLEDRNVYMHMYRSLLYIYRSLLYMYRSLLYMYRSLLYMYRYLLYMYRSLLYMYRYLLYMYRSLLYMYRYLLHMYRYLLYMYRYLLYMYRYLLHSIHFTCTAWLKSLNPHDDSRTNRERVCQKHESLPLIDFLSTRGHLIDISFIRSLKPNLCTALTTQNTTDNNCTIIHARTNMTALQLTLRCTEIRWSLATNKEYSNFPGLNHCQGQLDTSQ
jgi:hypothetical protein